MNMNSSKIIMAWKKFKKTDTYLTLWVSILSSLVATFIAFQFNTIFSKISARNDLLYNIQHLYIGSNKEWIDSKFGPATFTNEAGEYIESVYVTDIAILHIFYEQPSDSCCAFFVTLLSENPSDKIMMTDSYSRFVSGKPLGSYCYYEIQGEPISVLGNISQGVGRAFYGESYDYASSGNYYWFYFLTLDYGTLDYERDIATIGFTYDLSDSTIDDEVNLNKLYDGYIQIITNRKLAHPNTYGISALPEEETFELISSYRSFDSLQLRDNNGICP